MSLMDPRIAPPRTLDELREETVKRIAAGGYPGRGVRPADARAAMAALTSLDPEDWATVWMATGDRVVDEAERAEAPDDRRELFKSAYAAYTMGRFPTISTPGKQASYAKALAAYARYAALLPQPLETVRIPFEGAEIIGYFRKPDGPGRFPLMVQCGGLDYWKENVADEALAYLPHGIAVFGMDMPGTGQSPIKGDVGAERVFSAVFDWAETRDDIDATRMFMRGVSWGGHWATRVAIAEKDRLLGAINHGGAVHHFFQPDWQLKALGTREYLLDLFGARANVFGVKTLEEFLDYGPRMSLLIDDRIDRPTAPMLVMNGAKDSQVPIADQLLLLTRGDAKEGWINPKGAHMGFGAGWGPDRVIRDVIAPWLLKSSPSTSAIHERHRAEPDPRSGAAQLARQREPRRRRIPDPEPAVRPVQNRRRSAARRVALGDRIIDLAALSDRLPDRLGDIVRATTGPTLAPLIAQPAAALSALRAALSDLYRSDGPDRAAAEAALVPVVEAELLLPVKPTNFADFCCSIEHIRRMAATGGRPIAPCADRLPVGYNGRASSIAVSGTPVVRPKGQQEFPPGSGTIAYGPERRLDYELEFGAWLRGGNALGVPISVEEAEAMMVGCSLVNDWSARGIQFFESMLGPHLGKSFMTSVSPWIVTMEALAPFRVAARGRIDAEPPIPAHLLDPADRRAGGIRIAMAADLATATAGPVRICTTGFETMFWTLAQMIAHQASSGAPIEAGDLLASGTVSGPAEDARACLAEYNQRGANPVRFAEGSERVWLEDGDTLTITAMAHADGHVPIGFGPCIGTIHPAVPA